MKKIELTINEILKRETFRNARLLAGTKGLHRPIKWSHILEVKDFDMLINGGELILTTGISFPDDILTQLDYISRLIAKQAAGLCIEFGSSVTSLPSEVLSFADQHHFPIIVFEKTVKFVDITHDLHTMLINRHQRMLSDLDHLSSRFMRLSLAPNGIFKILQEMYGYFQQPVFFLSEGSKSFYCPADTKDQEAVLRAMLYSEQPDGLSGRLLTVNGTVYAVKPVQVFEQVRGYLCLQISDSFYDDFFLLVLDRAGLAVSQILLRTQTLEERKQHAEDELVRSLLQGKEVRAEHLSTYVSAAVHQMHYRVCVIQLNASQSNKTDWEEWKLQQTMQIRSLFQKHGCIPALSTSNHEIAVLAFFRPSETGTYDKFSRITETISQMKAFISSPVCIGVSSVFTHLSKTKEAYDESKESLELQRSGITVSPFYEKLGIYRLLFGLQKSGLLDRYVHDYLFPVLEYDTKTNGSLLETLAVYLECGGSKKEAAQKLFIVRQTLYHRLSKLESLLGENFMEPVNRLALEAAVQAYKWQTGQMSQEPSFQHDVL
ncbi:PucR family transcriptional regulator ligand-binding domain-containing protein [Domibacillus indicus]|uniref:PucR family transcriptional regulator n=1 Tax=Domibacillus indicus TaxID=1437523 RepID=UPI0020406352|nr:PucR family transcriptional regulator [Domibacillus indicus]MCM3791101.1 PucR family transcriptional regulator ligand-binding domain-containing protein [Domibacillus indicus]